MAHSNTGGKPSDNTNTGTPAHRDSHITSEHGRGHEQDISVGSTMPDGEVHSGTGQATSDLKTEPPSEKARVSNEQYSVFTHKEKLAIISAGSLAAFFSPLSSTIYLPALNTIATALNVTDSQVNITVTTYLILQGIAPMMVAGFADSMGRRPAYVACFVIYIFANLGLGLQNSYSALLGLRCLQSAGSSATVALSNGLVGDMVTSEQRGKYIAIASLGGLLGPTLSPIIGGLISQSLDWHWIFWFLLIFSGVFFVPLFLFLPETCRSIVGDGSIPPPVLNWSLTDSIRYQRRLQRGIEVDYAKQAELRKNYKFRLPSPVPTLKILFDFESAIILTVTGLGLACFYAIGTGASASFRASYGFGDLMVALMFVPFGIGGAVSAFTTGKIIDWNYRRHARIQGVTIIKGVRQDLTNFPIERARLEVALPLMILGNAFVVGYGWTMEQHVSVAAPVILLFCIGYTLMAAFQVMNILMVDIWPGNAASAAAANNFVRCELGAAASAAIEPMSAVMGRGWAYTTLGLLYLAFTPALMLTMTRGIEWRRVKREKRDAKAQKLSSGNP